MRKNNFGCRKVISIKVDALSHNCLFSRRFDWSPIFFKLDIQKSQPGMFLELRVQRGTTQCNET